MLQLINTLYHGTAEKFETIDVFKGRNNKDFGKGFYMDVTKSQAVGMMHKLGFLEPENLGTQYFVGKQEIADKLVVEMKEITWS